MIKNLLSALAAFIISSLSLFIKSGVDKSEIDTVGIITKLGFPLSYAQSAPGWSWIHYNGIHFGINFIIWLIIILLLRNLFVRKNKLTK